MHIKEKGWYYFLPQYKPYDQDIKDTVLKRSESNCIFAWEKHAGAKIVANVVLKRMSKAKYDKPYPVKH